jgi:cytochrome c-type biogenesis protein CcsB
MSRFGWEVLLHWSAVALYIGATALLANAVIFEQPHRVKRALGLAAIGLVPHAAAIVVRWVATGHGPYMLKYEVLSSDAWIAVAALLIFALPRRKWAVLGLVVLPLATLLIGAALFSNPAIRELPPTFRSTWLVFHIGLAKIAAGAFTLSLASAVLVLFDPGERKPWRARLPSPDALDGYTVRFVGFGLMFWTCAVAAGAIWAHQSWGRYWGWDPIETWSLVTWLVYGSFLHVRFFFRLGHRATAWLAIGAFAIFILTLLILPMLMPSLHSAYFQ